MTFNTRRSDYERIFKRSNYQHRRRITDGRGDGANYHCGCWSYPNGGLWLLGRVSALEG
ncbi:hypothetical protein [Enterobacter phage N5822]|nr:hypothetical protein [Enterobacter phage N5822]QPD96242.1 hypothetical protein [Enterobacter phage N5822]